MILPVNPEIIRFIIYINSYQQYYIRFFSEKKNWAFSLQLETGGTSSMQQIRRTYAGPIGRCWGSGSWGRAPEVCPGGSVLFGCSLPGDERHDRNETGVRTHRGPCPALRLFRPSGQTLGFLRVCWGAWTPSAGCHILQGCCCRLKPMASFYQCHWRKIQAEKRDVWPTWQHNKETKQNNTNTKYNQCLKRNQLLLVIFFF